MNFAERVREALTFQVDLLEVILIAAIFGIMLEYDKKEKITKGMAFAMAGVVFVYLFFYL